ncbi:tRNA-uridine aminocarboxypropyltransferase [Marinomonas sp. IMCC 4694]|uniref:tRNA-uridine aminocarboxypropyltransferase n=1 Tax=Marinomonas sp. IMCC 4694 TaxID=2605432 RepID=UPI0011E7E5AE|nr:tRNA-uridine aminocarboxypropyltransferase [Marinomonas sp. IMCC 4694]TYL48138.1 DTW domain-containing protein [Marinomonas sp. IMCC 4694]
MKHTQKPHCVDLLREQSKLNSTRPFVARGANVKRCPHCLMADIACFCHHKTQQLSPINFILLFHRDEIHKPTNSGRLIADLFPQNTKAFLWSRTAPPAELLDTLASQKGHCTLLYPSTETARSQHRQQRQNLPETSNESHAHTFIILDGTWKQASKMFHQSDWLKHIPHYELSSEAQRSFLVRHAQHDMQFATAEVTALLLDALGHTSHSKALLTLYQTFNQHCLMSRKRGNRRTV